MKQSGGFSIGPEEELDLGYCREHGRALEAYCTVCRDVVCPSCVMFGAHVGHTTQHPSHASRFLRSQIDAANRSGKLKPENSERFLSDIRETKLKCLNMKKTVLDEIDVKFNALIKALKTRREALATEVIDHFNEQLHQIEEQERRWVEKEGISKDLLAFSSSSDDSLLVKNAFIILSGIDSLNEKTGFQTARLVTSINSTLRLSKQENVKIGFSQLLSELENYGGFGEDKQVQYLA